MSEIIECKLTTRTPNGRLIRSEATLEYKDGRILFLKSPFSLKDEIKAMKGSEWHGYKEDDGRKIWSVEDCPRNRFQLRFLMGEDVYEWFDRDLIRHEYAVFRNGNPEKFMPHQCDLADSALTYHYQIWAAEMGTGKTLAAQQVIQKSGVKTWWWVGPKSSIPNIKREFRQWGFDFGGDINIDFITYEELTRRIDEWELDIDVLPQGVIFDESSRLKGAQSQRSRAAQRLADWMREAFMFDAFVIEMSGTPSPKTPVDWWSQCEIAWPGFLREGSPKALEQRCAFVVMRQFDSGMFPKNIGWKDSELKCKFCGLCDADGDHRLDPEQTQPDFHVFEPSINEVAYMYERLKGLVVIKHKKDCLTLPDKRYRKILCQPTGSVLRVASAIADGAPNTITGLTLLRELSDGFQYRDIEDGEVDCPHCNATGEIEEWFDPEDDEATYSAIEFLSEEFTSKLQKRTVDCTQCGGEKKVPKIVRITREIPCPKEKALKQLLEECEENGRIVVFAGFTGSVDRIQKVCHKEDWSVVRCDGRGFEVTDAKGTVITTGGEEALNFWADRGNQRVAFVSHPESGGMSLTLVEARMAVYWSNSFKPEYRSQSEDRIHRKGMDENLGCEIVDLIHLPTDERVLEVIQANRKLELMTMGDFRSALDIDGEDDGVSVETLAA